MAKVSSVLDRLDIKQTKIELEKTLFKYRDYLIITPSQFLPKVTQTYSIDPPTKTNSFHSTTETAALKRIEYESERDSFLEYIHKAVNGLKDDERQIIVKKYMLHNELGYDREIMMDLGLGKTKYSEIKKTAIVRLSFALNIEVYKRDSTRGDINS